MDSDEAKSFLKKSPAGLIILVVIIILGAAGWTVSQVTDLSKNTGIPISTISFVLVSCIAVITLVRLHLNAKTHQEIAASTKGTLPTPTKNASADPPIASENKDRIGELFRIGVSSIYPKTQIGSMPSIEVRIEVSNWSIFDARVRKIVYDLELDRGVGSPVHTLKKGKSYDREFRVPHQKGQLIDDTVEASPAVVQILAKEKAQSEKDNNSVPFTVKLEVYILFDGIGEKVLTGYSRVEVPPYSFR